MRRRPQGRAEQRGAGGVVDPRSLPPRDTATSSDAGRKTHRVLTVREAVQFGGIGAEITAQITAEAFDYLDAPQARLGGPFSPIPYSPALEKEWVVNADQIEEAALRVVNGQA